MKKRLRSNSAKSIATNSVYIDAPLANHENPDDLPGKNGIREQLAWGLLRFDLTGRP